MHAVLCCDYCPNMYIHDKAAITNRNHFSADVVKQTLLLLLFLRDVHESFD